MNDYDMLLMIDSDTVILDDITHLFKLPTHFATVLDEDKSINSYNSLGSMQGGVVLLRPCPAVTKHMIELLESHEELKFLDYHAEQDFFDWYFRYDRMTLSVRYNSIGHKLSRQQPPYTNRGGNHPVIVHYTRKNSDVLKFVPELAKQTCSNQSRVFDVFEFSM